jgi:hypothetical protein
MDTSDSRKPHEDRNARKLMAEIERKISPGKKSKDLMTPEEKLQMILLCHQIQEEKDADQFGQPGT